MEKLVRTIRKSAREELRVALSEFRTDRATHHMVSARVFYDDGPDFKPGRNGLNVKVDLLPVLIEALREAEREARAAGLLGDEGEPVAA